RHRVHLGDPSTILAFRHAADVGRIAASSDLRLARAVHTALARGAEDTTAGRDPTEQVRRPREARSASGSAWSRWGRAYRLVMASLVAMIAIILAGLVFAITMFQPAGPAVATTPSQTASGAASQSIPASASAPL